MGACNHFFLLNARDCGYAQVEDLGCAVVCQRNCGYARMGRFRMRSISKSRLTKGHEYITSSNVESFKIIKFLNILPSFAQ